MAAAASPSSAGSTPPSSLSFVSEQHVRYHRGNIPLVISAPHGGIFKGRKNDEEYPRRTNPNKSIPFFTNDSDIYSAELAVLLGESLVEQLNVILGPGGPSRRTPYLIIADIHRSRCDLNRKPEHSYPEGARGSQQSYERYHSWIAASVDEVVREYKFALLVDLHGQAHRPVSELGYLITSAGLGRSDAELDQLTNTSLQALKVKSGNSISDLVRGPSSFGALLAGYGYFSCPSPLLPTAEVLPVCTVATSLDGLSILASTHTKHLHKQHQREFCRCEDCRSSSGSLCCCSASAHCCGQGYFFPGGHTTRQYLSENVSAIQIETPAGPRHDLPTAGLCFARALASTLVKYMNLHGIYPPILR